MRLRRRTVDSKSFALTPEPKKLKYEQEEERMQHEKNDKSRDLLMKSDLHLFQKMEEIKK